MLDLEVYNRLKICKTSTTMALNIMDYLSN